MFQYPMRLVVLALTAAVPHTVSKGDSPTSVDPLTREQMRQELNRLEGICNRLGLHAEAEISRNWLQEQRSDQRRFYLPSEFPPVLERSDSMRWREHFIKARRQYAAFLHDQAIQAADSGDEATAYRLLWQVLREDPRHPQALKILGPLSSAVSARPQRRAMGTANEFSTLGDVQRWQSRHFEIYSRAPAVAAQRLASQLEQYYAVWTQCFYELWAPPGLLRARLAGEHTGPWPERGRLEVVYLADRAEYLKLLGLAESNIAVSVGYYNPQVKRSFFYQGEDNRETVFHELTHQLFAEASVFALPKDARLQLDQLPGAWCIEGVALYMESLWPTAEGWTVGGVDSLRLQTARYRALRDSYWPAWEAFTDESIAQWKEKPKIALAYSHAVGLTHLYFDLHQDQPAARQTYLQYLAGVYLGQASSDPLFKLLGSDDEKASQNYRRLMTLDDAQLESLISSSDRITQLVLSRSQLSSWQRLAHFRRLEWLDLSFTNIGKDQMVWLSELKELRRLSLEGTQIEGDALRIISQLPKLQELDLSQCQIDDDQLNLIGQHPSLEVLWLNQTQVSEQALKLIQSLPKLRECDVSQTRMNPEVWEEFVRKHQRLSK